MAYNSHINEFIAILFVEVLVHAQSTNCVLAPSLSSLIFWYYSTVHVKPTTMFQLHQYHKEYKKDLMSYEFSGTDIVCYQSMYLWKYMCLKFLLQPHFSYWVKTICCGVHNVSTNIWSTNDPEDLHQ